MKNVVHLEDYLGDGISAGIVHIQANPSCGTLIDLIPEKEWDVWDCSRENPTVIDRDGV